MSVLTRLITRIRRGQALRRAQEAREVAWQAWCEAKQAYAGRNAKRDTRGMSQTWKPLNDAMNRRLRLELGR